jgi:hypothetical protein
MITVTSRGRDGVNNEGWEQMSGQAYQYFVPDRRHAIPFICQPFSVCRPSKKN